MSSLPASPVKASSSSARARAGPTRFVRRSAPQITFSSTVMRPKLRTTCQVRAMPRRQTRSGRAWEMSAPSSTIRPSSGWSAPLMQLKSVVLPAPLGPIRPTISPGSMRARRRGWPRGRRSAWCTHSTCSSGRPSRQPFGRLAPARGRETPGRPALPRQREQPVGSPARDQHDDRAVDDEVDAAAGQRARAERGGHELGDRDQDDRAQHRAPQPPEAAHHRRHHGQDVPVHLEHLIGEDGQRPEAVEHAARPRRRRP